jgi:CO/xanthine dehydrogenase FAD-binding subunit
MLYQSYYAPETVEEAITHLVQANGNTVKLIAGGTDLMVQLRERMVHADTLVDVSGIAELRRIWVDEHRLHIGASVTYTQLIESELIHEHAYLLAEASRVVGAPQIQHMGTIGGNLGNASPAGDTLPCLHALEAEVTLKSLEGERQLAMSDYMLGVRKTAMQPSELITKVSFEIPQGNVGSAFAKLGLRRSQAISVVDVAALVFLDDDRISNVRIALGSVAPTIVRSRAVEQILTGQIPSDDLLDRAAEAARQDISPITDIRSSAAYRLHTIKPLVRQALETALERAGARGQREEN